MQYSVKNAYAIRLRLSDPVNLAPLQLDQKVAGFRRPHGESHRTLKGTESAFSLCVSVELMAFHSYIVAAGFHTRVDAIEPMKQVVAEVTAPRRSRGCGRSARGD